MGKSLREEIVKVNILPKEIHLDNIDKWNRTSDIALRNTAEIDQLKAALDEIKRSEWKSALLSREKSGATIVAQKTSIYLPINISLDVRTTFEKLEKDFSDFSNRIVWCNELKNCLSKFEEELEEYDAKYLSWFVSTLKDVFSYNYAETITEEQLGLLKNGIETIYEKQENCDKGSFAEYHLQLVESGLSLLPTTQKAIDEFGE